MFAFLRRFSRPSTVDIAVHQVLPAEARLEGKLTFSGGLHIQGHVQGTLVPQGPDTGIVVDRSAHVITEALEADTVLVHGQVSAQVIRARRIVLSGSAQVTGALEAAEVEIQKGALFEGRVFIKRPALAEPTARMLSSTGSASIARDRLREAVSTGEPVSAGNA